MDDFAVLDDRIGFIPLLVGNSAMTLTFLPMSLYFFFLSFLGSEYGVKSKLEHSIELLFHLLFAKYVLPAPFLLTSLSPFNVSLSILERKERR